MDTGEFEYCPFCGSHLSHSDRGEDNAPRCVKCERVFYSAPHPTVSAIIADEDNERVLLTRRKFDPMKGYWDIPGGFLDMGESLEDGLRREIREELGVEIRIISSLGSYPDVYGPRLDPTINIFYLTMIVEGNPTPGSDVSEIQWFDHEKIPTTISFENGRLALDAWLEQRSARRKGT